MKVLIIDNYDSFTYNLYQYMGEILESSGNPFTLSVVRNDEKSFGEIRSGGWDRIVISPGPGHPGDPEYFGVSAAVITDLSEAIPVLGVCLGMQGMAHYNGGSVVRARLPMHGKVSEISHDGNGVFAGIPQKVQVMRYHSLVVDPESLPASLEVTSWVTLEDGSIEIMGLRHKNKPFLEGIQFHPESFATEDGMGMLRNFLFFSQR